ncbi:MAG TPA: helix-turn-helix domain-containing protein [Verrucomicrobiae bacterium]|nr:helix-turn-helix domain-containing protein [Verrucomicrobiae bacterium]
MKKTPPTPPGAIAEMRLKVLARFDAFKKSRTNVAAAKRIGVSIPTLWRWCNQYSAHGLAGLQPQWHKSGRRSPFANVRFTQRAIRQLEMLIARAPYPRAGWVQFSQSPLCPPSVAEFLKCKGRPPFKVASAVQPVRLNNARLSLSADGRRIFLKMADGNFFKASLTRI